MWESVKNWSSVCNQEATCDWLASGDLLECVTRVEHVESWRVRTGGSLQDKNYKLVFLLSSDWDLWLIPIANDSLVHPVLLKTDFSHSISYPTINTLIPTKCKELPKRILREKSQRKIRLIHPQSYTFDSPNSSTLTLSIVTSLRGTLAKSLSHHTHICEEAFWYLGRNSLKWL